MSQLKSVVLFAAFVLTAIVGSATYASAEPQRLALVIGQGAYGTGQLPTAVNDAGLVAQALTGAGFEVIQGRDLGGNDLRNIMRDFLDKAQALEPGSAVAVYLSGHGIQLEGENYLLPVDARIQRDVDVPIEGFRLSDLVRSIERTPAQARVIIADMARDYPLASTGAPIAKGLALMEPPAGFLIAFSSAPNIVAADGPGPYGAYATALVETMRQPSLPLDEVFARVRLRTHEATKGLQTPWHAANLPNGSFVFFEAAEPAAAAPAPQVRRIEDVSPEEAYAIAVERDTIQDYQAFLRRYPDHSLARRVTALLASRREALIWRRTLSRNTSEAYWTYLRRYPSGPHAEDCRRRLARLSAPLSPPPVFEEVVYEDLPPPLPVVETVDVVEVVTIIRDAPPPPPPPVYLLPPPDDDDEVIVTTIFREPPPPPLMAGILPIPAPIPVPVRARPPALFYQPIAPVTPRGAVAIPVASPPVLGALMGASPGAPRPARAPRPQQPTLPDQPGLAAPIQPLPISTSPTLPRPRGNGARPGQEEPQPRPGRLPVRPIPLPGSPSVPRQPGAAYPQPTITIEQPNRGVAPAPVAPAPREAGRPDKHPGARPGLPVPTISVIDGSHPPAAPARGRHARDAGMPLPRIETVPSVSPRAPEAGEPVMGARPRPGRSPVEVRERPARPFPGERPQVARPVIPEQPRIRQERPRPAAPPMPLPTIEQIGGPRAPQALRPLPAPGPQPHHAPPAMAAQPPRPAGPPPMAQPRGMGIPTITYESRPTPVPGQAAGPQHGNAHQKGCLPIPGNPCPKR